MGKHVYRKLTGKDAIKLVGVIMLACVAGGEPLAAASACDLNGDGLVNIVDVQIVINQAVGASPCSSGDLDADGRCDVIDVQRIINAALGDGCNSGVGVSGVNISPGTEIQSVVDANPTGTTFVITPGVYRMQSVTPNNGDIFLGQPGAILNGSRLLTSFGRSGSYWIAVGQTQHGTPNGKCLAGYSGCEYPEDLFFNNVPLQRVESLSLVTAGKWYFDYPTQVVYFLDDPTGKTVEIGVTTHAFSGSATNVTIKGLTIEKYAVPAQDGAISGGAWTIDSNEIRLNHGAGIHLYSNQKVTSNYIHHNGELGLGGSNSDSVLIQDNEIAYNNTLNFDFATWEAGGAKFSNMTNLVVQGNYVHDNKGDAFHLDYQCYNWTIQANRTSNNYVAGIVDEISYDGTARYNVIVNDALYPGKTNPSMWWACGILNNASPNANVYGNTLINNSNGICAISYPRGSGNRGEHLVQNYNVHNNLIVQSVSSAAGAVASTANSGYYLNVYSSAWNNHWTSNTYQLSNTAGKFYTWKGGTSYANMDDTQWQIYGQDTAGTWIPSTDTSFLSTAFSAYQRLHTLSSTQVWSLPTPTSTLVATEGAGALGTVTQVAGPILSGGVWWWMVKYDDGKEGWSLETNLSL